MTLDHPIFSRWPAQYPDRLQLFSLPTPNGVKIGIMLEETGLAYEPHRIDILATCRTSYKTGVEMEAMMACSVAALTIYDMCKAADKGIVIEQVRLKYKAGGKSGEWRND